MKRISLYELAHTPTSVLQKQYNLSVPQLEQSLRWHCNDATKKEMQSVYKEVYNRKKEDNK